MEGVGRLRLLFTALLISVTASSVVVAAVLVLKDPGEVPWSSPLDLSLGFVSLWLAQAALGLFGVVLVAGPILVLPTTFQLRWWPGLVALALMIPILSQAQRGWGVEPFLKPFSLWEDSVALGCCVVYLLKLRHIAIKEQRLFRGS